MWEGNPSLLRLFGQQDPVRRVGKPDDIAHAVRFRGADEASSITKKWLYFCKICFYENDSIFVFIDNTIAESVLRTTLHTSGGAAASGRGDPFGIESLAAKLCELTQYGNKK
jgi:hypothetical protein